MNFLTNVLVSLPTNHVALLDGKHLLNIIHIRQCDTHTDALSNNRCQRRTLNAPFENADKNQVERRIKQRRNCDKNHRRHRLSYAAQDRNDAVETDKQKRSAHINPEISHRFGNHIVRRFSQSEQRFGNKNTNNRYQHARDQHKDKERRKRPLHLVILPGAEELRNDNRRAAANADNKRDDKKVDEERS